VNLSVIQYFFIARKQRTGSALFHNLLFPLAGALVCIYVWMNLSTQAKIVGFIWLAIGGLQLAIHTRGFRQAPSQWSGEELK
jgi:hypothetical protein